MVKHLFVVFCFEQHDRLDLCMKFIDLKPLVLWSIQNRVGSVFFKFQWGGFTLRKRPGRRAATQSRARAACLPLG